MVFIMADLVANTGTYTYVDVFVYVSGVCETYKHSPTNTYIYENFSKVHGTQQAGRRIQGHNISSGNELGETIKKNRGMTPGS